MTGLLWWGLLPPVLALAMLQTIVGGMLAILIMEPLAVDTTWILVLVLIVLVGLGPATIASGLMNNAANARDLGGRHRLVAAGSLPLTILSLTPIFGLLPAILALEYVPAGRTPRDPESATCPCGYRMALARQHARPRCPECGAVLSWSFGTHPPDRLLWLLGLIGTVWIFSAPFLLAPITLPTTMQLFASVIVSLLVAVQLLNVVRRGWVALPRSRVPRSAWLFVGLVPMIVTVVVSLVIGL